MTRFLRWCISLAIVLGALFTAVGKAMAQDARQAIEA